MTTIYNPVGRNIRLRFLLISPVGVGVTGASPRVIIKRRSDGMYWTGGAWSSSVQLLAMSEEDSVNVPGTYFRDFDQAAAGGSPEEYLVRYSSTSVLVGIDEEQQVFTTQATSLVPDIRPGHVLADDGVTFSAAVWVESGGQRVTNYDSIAAQIKDSSSTLIVDLGTDTSDTLDGIFSFSTNSGTIPRNVPLVMTLQAVKGAETDTFNLGFTKV
jgi:hypothetical protein